MDFAVGRDLNDAEPPSGFGVGRTVRMFGQIWTREVDANGDLGDWAPLDINNARWIPRVRAWRPTDRTAVLATIGDVALTKSTTGAATGFFDHPFDCGIVEYASALEWEYVLTDTSNAQSGTKSTWREYVLLEWKAAIPARPRA